ncbi:MAG: tetratricopeptide repeat protein, partial [Betaproteobacteria bacterium]|nr:tetratricopeptide repeat protein [Betaproteobacteria bacterium]
LTQALAFARAGSGGPGEPELRARLAANPADLEARLALAQLYAGGRRYREAMDELLESIRRDKAYQDGAARKQIVAIFSLAESQPELVSEYRRKLASALY